MLPSILQCSWWQEDSTTDLYLSHVYFLFIFIHVMLICVKNNLFYSFHNDNSYIKPYFNINNTLILSGILKSLDSKIFVCKCLVQCDLLRVTEAFSYKRAWQQKSAEWPVSIVNIPSLIKRNVNVLSQFLFNSFFLLSNCEKTKEKIACVFVIACVTEPFSHGKQTNTHESISQWQRSKDLITWIVTRITCIKCMSTLNFLQKAHSKYDEDKFILSTS